MSEAGYDAYLKYRRDTAVLLSCASVLGWDHETYMPSGGGQIRASQLALLQGLAHRRKTAGEFGDLVAAAEEQVAGEDPDSAVAANVRIGRREHDLATRVPAELVEELARTTTLARKVWIEARQEDDFALFLPWLEKIVILCRRKAEALGGGDQLYDALLDEYEPGETTAGIAAVFGPLRDVHVNLLERILKSGTAVDSAPLHRSFPIRSQESFARRAAAAIGFDFERGRLDVTAHPFCSGAGPDDVRLTTRYDEGFFGEAFFGVLHEAGHGIYEQGLSMDHFGTPMGEACSLAMHESQSRMWENLVGRSRGFWRHFFPAAQEAFPGALGDLDAEGFFRAVNEVRPSLIRVEADEVTYNLHIFLRFELEQALVDGSLQPRDVPGAWNEKTEEFLRLRPPNDADGCLQDIHWSLGTLGYFPTYALGNLYAAQIFEQAQRDLGNLSEQFAQGEFGTLRKWLNERVHHEGRRLEPRRLVEAVTGAPPTHESLKRHLETKYGEIYGL